MVANGAVAYPDNVPIRDAIATGEIDVGLINHYYVAQAVAAEGHDYPVEVHFPPDDLGSLILLTASACSSRRERKEEAFDFVRSLLSDEAQELLHRDLEGVPARRRASRPIPRSRCRSPTSRAPDVDLSDSTDLQGTLELMQEAGAL